MLLFSQLKHTTHTHTQSDMSQGFLCPLGASYQSPAHVCPVTQNTSLSAASCFLLTADDTSLAHNIFLGLCGGASVQQIISTLGLEPEIKALFFWIQVMGSMQPVCTCRNECILDLGLSLILTHFLQISHTPHILHVGANQWHRATRGAALPYVFPIT